MALKRIYCSSCGLEILADENFIVEKNMDADEAYHGEPYICYPYRGLGWF